MIKILVTALLLLMLSPLYAQEQQAIRVYCNESKVIWQQLRKEYGEEPILLGRGPEGTTGVMTLWMNPNTLTWTILVTTSDKTCIIGGGGNFTIVEKK